MSITYRQCTIDLANQSNFILHDPSAFLISGMCDTPLPLWMGHSDTGSALFSKTPHTACGVVAVFTYKLHNKSAKQDERKMAVMFSVPYDFNFYSNWYAVGVFDKETQCDHALYEKMYYGKQQGFIRGKASGPSLTYRDDDDITIAANMTDTYQPVLTVDVSISSRNRVTSQKKRGHYCRCC
ncbi:DELTA-stichotoxin-Hmg2b-like [Mugil cephalus]|uniref:DELTA-stichotoxin-Hmg2b-like n=1 Tax=Mugil cephalus TaxID=48193 RepID=UPI001FB821C2|nr:DELTA-stichotoxin-Hmg2b-like [Mugil cephalus]